MCMPGLPAHAESRHADKPWCHLQGPGHTLGNHQCRFSHGHCPLSGLAVTLIGPCQALPPPPPRLEKPVLSLPALCPYLQEGLAPRGLPGYLLSALRSSSLYLAPALGRRWPPLGRGCVLPSGGTQQSALLVIGSVLPTCGPSLTQRGVAQPLPSHSEERGLLRS